MVTKSSSRRAVQVALLAVSLLVGVSATAQLPPPSPVALDGTDAYAAMDLANAWKGETVTSFVTPSAVHHHAPARA